MLASAPSQSSGASASEGGAGESRTRVQTWNHPAFYMFILQLVFDQVPATSNQIPNLSSKFRKYIEALHLLVKLDNPSNPASV